jgi:predicted HTH transcriptional regulator
LQNPAELNIEGLTRLVDGSQILKDDGNQTIFGENVAVEFKRAGNGIHADSYESICALLNRFGGDVYFGVLDDGTVEGVFPNVAPELVRNLINNLGNPNLFVPAVHLEPDPKNNPIVAAFFRTIGFADELGSGICKMFKYGKSFGGADPTLTEGDIFRDVLELNSEFFPTDFRNGAITNNHDVPINDTINDTINETINETIKSSPGISLVGIAEKVGKSRATVARAVASLKKAGRIEHRGSKKTGGYYLVGQ